MKIGSRQISEAKLAVMLRELRDAPYRKILRRAVEDSDLSQRDLAELTGIPRGTIAVLVQEYQRDATGRPIAYYPSIEQHVRFAEATGDPLLALWPLAQIAGAREDKAPDVPLNPETIHRDLCQVSACLGELIGCINQALEDRRFSQDELQEIFERSMGCHDRLALITGGAKAGMRQVETPARKGAARRVVHCEPAEVEAR